MKEEPLKEILLHICCAPDATAVVERLNAKFSVTGFFYNPCIWPEEEYIKRLNETKKVAEIMGFHLLEGEYEIEKWNDKIKGLEDEPEGGKRCFECYFMRLDKTAEVASRKGIEFFTTTLSISPHKNFDKILEIGKNIEKIRGVQFYGENFKKMNGFKRSVELSKSFGLYRQKYCGCKYSLKRKP